MTIYGPVQINQVKLNNKILQNMNIITRTSDIMLLGKHIFKESEICPWTFM